MKQSMVLVAVFVAVLMASAGCRKSSSSQVGQGEPSEAPSIRAATGNVDPCEEFCHSRFACELGKTGKTLEQVRDSANYREWWASCLGSCQELTAADRECWDRQPCDRVVGWNRGGLCPDAPDLLGALTEEQLLELVAAGTPISITPPVREGLIGLFDDSIPVIQRVPALGGALDAAKDEFDRREIEQNEIPKIEAELRQRRARVLGGRYRALVGIYNVEYDFKGHVWRISPRVVNPRLSLPPFPTSPDIVDWEPVKKVISLWQDEEHAKFAKDQLKLVDRVEIELDANTANPQDATRLETRRFRLCGLDPRSDGYVCSPWQSKHRVGQEHTNALTSQAWAVREEPLYEMLDL